MNMRRQLIESLTVSLYQLSLYSKPTDTATREIIASGRRVLRAARRRQEKPLPKTKTLPCGG